MWAREGALPPRPSGVWRALGTDGGPSGVPVRSRLDSSRAPANRMQVVSIRHYDGSMTRFRTSLVGFSALLGTLGGCAAPMPTDGGLKSSTQSAAAPVAPGPGWLLLG